MKDAALLHHLTLPADLVTPAAGAVSDRPSSILVTGATGYLGAYLVAALLERSQATIVCLVRAADAASGLARLRTNLAYYALDVDLSRVRVVTGAVEAPCLGLDDATWRSLADEIDVIVDAAASVNFLSPLDRLLAVNVGGPLNLLRLAGASRPKPLHLSSSYSVFNAASYADVRVALEDPLTGDGEGFRGGYPASKWIAERLGDLARDRGWNVTMHRIGYLWGDTCTGRSKPSDALTLNVRACLAMNMAQDVDTLMHITPVDFAAAAIAQIALAPAHANRHYHTLTDDPITWRTFVAGMRQHGHPVELVPFETWHAALHAMVGTHREFLSLVLAGSFNPDRTTRANISDMRFDVSQRRLALAGTGVECPPLDPPLIGTYLDAMQETGSGAPAIPS